MHDKNHPLLGKEIGKYRLNGSFVDHNASFHTASWYEDTKVEPDIYPIILGVDSYSHVRPFFLCVKYKGKVVDDYFPSSLGGVVYSKPDKKHVGEKRDINRRISWEKSLPRVGNSPNKQEEGDDIYIDPKYWKDIEEIASEELQGSIKSFEYFKEKMDTSGIENSSKWINSSAKFLSAIQDLQNYYSQDTFKKLKDKNWEWAIKKREVIKEICPLMS